MSQRFLEVGHYVTVTSQHEAENGDLQQGFSLSPAPVLKPRVHRSWAEWGMGQPTAM